MQLVLPGAQCGALGRPRLNRTRLWPRFFVADTLPVPGAITCTGDVFCYLKNSFWRMLRLGWRHFLPKIRFAAGAVPVLHAASRKWLQVCKSSFTGHVCIQVRGLQSWGLWIAHRCIKIAQQVPDKHSALLLACSVHVAARSSAQHPQHTQQHRLVQHVIDQTPATQNRQGLQPG